MGACFYHFWNYSKVVSCTKKGDCSGDIFMIYALELNGMYMQVKESEIYGFFGANGQEKPA